MTALASYSTGTVSVGAGGTTVTGVGTIWNDGSAKPGDILQIGNFQSVITDVTDVTHLVIPPWGGGAQSGVAYKIWKVSPQRFAGAQAMQRVNDLVAALDSEGFFWFVGVGATAPDASYGDDGQYAYQPSTGAYWLKTGGVWVASGSPTKGYGGTSTTSRTIATGSPLAFTTQANLAYTAASRVRGVSSADPTKWIEGPATYTGTTLTITPDSSGGSGAVSDWAFSLAGQPGNMSGANNLSELTNPITAHDRLIARGSDIASAATLNLDSATGEILNVTGTTNIGAITLTNGRRRVTRFLGALTITAGGSIVLPYGMASYITTSGDMIEWVSYGGTATAVAFYPATAAAQRAAIGAAQSGAAGGFVSGMAPTGTAAASPGVHMGMGASCQLTPATTGRLRVEFNGNMTAGSVISGNVQIRYGLVSGGVPSNAAAPAGTAVGNVVTSTVAGASYHEAFSIKAQISGLIKGAAYWFDLVLFTGSGSTISIDNTQFDGFEF